VSANLSIYREWEDISVDLLIPLAERKIKSSVEGKRKEIQNIQKQ
jgi:hypothetical protein